mmetsp:Transcript_11313/g.19638  ORF Transcript_11313/g.19638 Transcript_11313/m.19638 type:complete len:84 (+) Transcript_11313:1094-1345(+)
MIKSIKVFNMSRRRRSRVRDFKILRRLRGLMLWRILLTFDSIFYDGACEEIWGEGWMEEGRNKSDSDRQMEGWSVLYLFYFIL